MFEKISNFTQIFTKKPKNYEIIYKSPKVRIPLNIRIKRLFIWLELMEIEDSIEEIFLIWSKSLLVWLFNVLMTGSLIFLAVLPFYSVPFKLIPFVIFSFGIAYYVFMETLKEIRNILKVKGKKSG